MSVIERMPRAMAGSRQSERGSVGTGPVALPPSNEDIVRNAENHGR